MSELRTTEDVVAYAKTTSDIDTNFSEQWQKVLISMLLSDQTVWNTCCNQFKPEYFNDKLKNAVNFIREYDSAYKQLPTSEQIVAKTGTHVPKFSEPTGHTEATVREFEKFVKYRALENVILDGLPLLESGAYDALLKNTQAAHDIRIGNGESAFAGVWIDECQTIDPPQFLIGPWLVKDTVTCVYGSPGSFKSFFCLEAGFRLATGTPFAGRPVSKTSVAYIAAEGQAGIALRLEALRERHGITADRTSMRIITQPVNLLDDDEVARLIAHLKDLERREAIDFGLVVLDTYSQCIAGADENSQAVASKASGNMIRIRRELETTVVYVHHTGKDQSRGMRGSDALRANTDGAVEITRDDGSMHASAIVVRAKDAPLYGRIAFQMSVQPIARLAGRELDASLVADFIPEHMIRSMPQNAPGERLTPLADLIRYMSPGDTLSLGKALVLTGRHDTKQYKEAMAIHLPFGTDVVVKNNDEIEIGRLRRQQREHRANDVYGEVICLSKSTLDKKQ